MKPTCFMCKKRPARPLTAARDKRIYVNAQNVTLFCSVRCAANYGLLWGGSEINETWHFCQVAKEWRAIDAEGCQECQSDPSARREN